MVKKIMVPLDLKTDSFNTLQHAADVAVRNGAEIHLVHVLEKPSLWEKAFLSSRWDHEYPKKRILLADWKKTLEIQFDIPVLGQMIEGKICSGLLDYVIANRIDLIFMGTKSQESIYTKNSGYTSKKLSRLSGIAVATIFHNSVTTFKWKNVVVPVSHVKPEKRIRILLHYAMLYNIKIHFVTVHARSMDDSREQFDLLVECLKFVKIFGNIAVECINLEGDDLTNAAWRYAKKIDADALITNSGNEIYMKKNIPATQTIQTGWPFVPIMKWT